MKKQKFDIPNIRIKYSLTRGSNMKNVRRVYNENAWVVQLLHKKKYYSAYFSDFRYNGCWAQSAVAAKIYLLKLRDELGIISKN